MNKGINEWMSSHFANSLIVISLQLHPDHDIIEYTRKVKLQL